MRGAVYGAYAVLEVLGEPILHPLRRITEPVKASWESWPVPANSLWVEKPNWKVCLAGLSHWRMSLEDLTGSTAQYVRRWHYHTQHPLELTSVLQGTEPSDASWSASLDEAELFFEWLAAQKVNQIQWVLLEFPGRFGGRSPARQHRLQEVVENPTNSIYHPYSTFRPPAFLYRFEPFIRNILRTTAIAKGVRTKTDMLRTHIIGAVARTLPFRERVPPSTRKEKRT
eukprot:9292102-Pyramimonas_sp.AAC.1